MATTNTSGWSSSSWASRSVAALMAGVIAPSGAPGVEHHLDGGDHARPHPVAQQRQAAVGLDVGRDGRDRRRRELEPRRRAGPRPAARPSPRSPTATGRPMTRCASRDHRPWSAPSPWPRPKPGRGRGHALGGRAARAGPAEARARPGPTPPGPGPAAPERAQERDRDYEKHAEPNSDGDTRQDDGATGGRHGGDNGVLDRAGLVSQFLPEAVDDQQRVVDGQAEADELDHVGHIEHHQEFVGQGIDEGQGGRGGAQGYDERHQDGQGEPQGQGQQAPAPPPRR